TVQVWVEMENPGERLKPGATVHVAIVAAPLKNVVVVSTAAVRPSAEGDTGVMVVSDSRAHEHKVEVGVREPNKVQLLGGVNAGKKGGTCGGGGPRDTAH